MKSERTAAALEQVTRHNYVSSLKCTIDEIKKE